MSDFLSGLYPDALKPPKSPFYDPAPTTPRATPGDGSGNHSMRSTGDMPAAYQPAPVAPAPSPYAPPSGGVTAPNISASPTSPNLTRDIYAPQLNDVTQKLNAAYQAPRPGMARQIIGGVLTGMNPRNPIGGLVSGETQQQQKVKPLTDQYSLLSNIIQQNRAAQTADLSAANVQSEISHRGAQADYWNRMANVKEDPADKQPTSEVGLFLKDPALAQKFEDLKASNKPDKTPNEKEQEVSDYLEGRGMPNTPAMRDKARMVLATRNRPPKDPDLADLNKQLKEGQLKKQQEAENAVSPATQKVLQTTTPTIEQVDRLLDTLEPVKNDNKPLSSMMGRLKYATGIGAGPDDQKAGDIQKQLGEMEMDRVIAGARVLQGSSRAYQALQLAMKHAPDPWKDSKALMYQKLSTIRQNLQDVSDDAVKYGKKSGSIPAIPGPRVAPVSAGPTGGMVRARDPQGQLHEAPAGTALPTGWKPE